MSSLAKSLGLLMAIVAFSAVALVGLLRQCPPLTVLKKGGICAVVLGVVAWVCTHVALDVIVAGIRAHRQEDEGA